MIQFNADHVKVNGPRESDGNLSITFTTGEYEQDKIAELLKIEKDKVLKVTIEEYDG